MAKGKYQRWLEPDGLILLEGWARDGLTDEQIAHNCGCGVRTLYDWKEKHSQISQALKKGKEVVDREVENALLKRALGYEYEEKRIKQSGDGIEKTITKKHVSPDVTAIIYWLKNRMPERYRDKPEPKHASATENDLFAKLEESVNELHEVRSEADNNAALVDEQKT